jgi:hypothetical protein
METNRNYIISWYFFQHNSALFSHHPGEFSHLMHFESQLDRNYSQVSVSLLRRPALGRTRDSSSHLPTQLSAVPGQAMKGCGRVNYIFRHLNFGLRLFQALILMLWLLYSRRISPPFTLRGWVGPTGCLDVLEKEKISCLCL